MGTSEADVRRVFGEPGGSDGFSPLGESFGEIGGAPAVRNWPPNDRAEPTVIRSEPVARGTVGERIRIWFSEDPIRSMTLARVGRA